jgi:hypothetical protein
MYFKGNGHKRLKKTDAITCMKYEYKQSVNMPEQYNLRQHLKLNILENSKNKKHTWLVKHWNLNKVLIENVLIFLLILSEFWHTPINCQVFKAIYWRQFCLKKLLLASQKLCCTNCMVKYEAISVNQMIVKRQVFKELLVRRWMQHQTNGWDFIQAVLCNLQFGTI